MTIGDWGDFEARTVAPLMGNFEVDWIVSTGDNFYNDGVKGPDDPQFQSKFEKQFTAKSTQVPWYVTAGNHDYYGGSKGIQAEISYSDKSKRWNFPSFYYDFVKKGSDGSTAHFVSIDTWRLNGGDTNVAFDPVSNRSALRNVSHLQHKVNTGDMDPRTYKQLMESIPEQDPQNPVISSPDDKQYQWIQSTLGNSTADWLIVYGHFPVYSATTGEHGDTKSLVTNLAPMFNQAGVHAYFNGHDHILQHIVKGSTHYFTSGAGARKHSGVNKDYDGLQGYLENQYGFMFHSISKDTFATSFINQQGKVIYAYNITK
eukprot:CAMPEP_0175139590 /NCGR_PEP_ID=MMETSP0087-20121206/10993_1 /TAXON_ID=136419 /ORGANISM="Unknown Unknown, Strain D1" /LENGTH=314 /DNA_ID=CAMNT_0016422629 /DNA_START=90 /DNA_END=1034 /DNA_ORIENTATION=-